MKERCPRNKVNRTMYNAKSPKHLDKCGVPIIIIMYGLWGECMRCACVPPLLDPWYMATLIYFSAQISLNKAILSQADIEFACANVPFRLDIGINTFQAWSRARVRAFCVCEWERRFREIYGPLARKQPNRHQPRLKYHRFGHTHTQQTEKKSRRNRTILMYYNAILAYN